MNISKPKKRVLSLLIVSTLGCLSLSVCATAMLTGLFRLDEALQQQAQELALSRLPPMSTIEAKYEDVLGEIGNMTQGTLLEDVVVSELGSVSPDVYLGCIRGYRERVYGTRHDFNEVLALYTNEFSVPNGWQQVKTDLDTASFSSQNTRLQLIAFPYTEDRDPVEWADYFTLYRLHIMYAEPSLRQCTG